METLHFEVPIEIIAFLPTKLRLKRDQRRRSSGFRVSLVINLISKKSPLLIALQKIQKGRATRRRKTLINYFRISVLRSRLIGVPYSRD